MILIIDEGPGAPSDPDWSTVKLLARTSGATVIDAGPVGRSLVGLGDCTVSTEQTLFGSPVIKSPAGDPLKFGASSDWDLNRYEWQWDIWFYKTTGSNSLIARRQPSTTNGWAICDDSLRAKINGSWSDTAMLWTRPSENAFHLLTLTKLDTSMYALVDGDLKTTLTGVSSIGDLDNPLWFFQADNGSENRANGYFAEARFSHKARNTSNFTPPTAPWPGA